MNVSRPTDALHIGTGSEEEVEQAPWITPDTLTAGVALADVELFRRGDGAQPARVDQLLVDRPARPVNVV